MKTPQDICREWAADFKQKGIHEEANLWQALSLKGPNAEIQGDGLKWAIYECKLRIQVALSLSKDNAPDNDPAVASMREAREEAEALLAWLESHR